ncbi:MAG: CHAT domain-containing protein [Prolixibacteraceae bacterium]|nr:CHAT domain-containing protein [Prolixibacteraceae bacterium]
MANYINIKINIEQGGICFTKDELPAPRSPFQIDDDDTKANNIRVELGIAKVFHKVLNLIKTERELFQKEDFELLGEMLSKIMFGRINNNDDIRNFIMKIVEQSLEINNSSSKTICRIYLEFDQKSGVAMLPWEYILYKTRSLDVPRSIYLSANLKSRFHLMRRVKDNNYERPFSERLFVIVLVNVAGNGDVEPPIDSRTGELKTIEKTFKTLQDKFFDKLVVEYIESTPFNKIKQEVEEIYKRWEIEYQQKPSYAIHYLGHSMLDEQVGKLVALSAETGKPDWVEDKKFAAIFNEEKLNIEQPCMVCFQSCDSAKIGSFNDILRGVAIEFTKINIPAVIGMQNEINTAYSCAFFDRFYESILNEKDVAEAVTAGRDYLGREYNNDTDAYINNSFGSPVLFITTKEPIQIIQAAAAPVKMVKSEEFKPEMNMNIRNSVMMDRISSNSNMNDNRTASIYMPDNDDSLYRSVKTVHSDLNPVSAAQPIIDPRDTSSPNVQPKNSDE